MPGACLIFPWEMLPRYAIRHFLLGLSPSTCHMDCYHTATLLPLSHRCQLSVPWGGWMV